MKSFKITQSITDRQDTSLKLFLKEVSKLPMITQEEEIELAKRIQKGDQKAIDKLIESNLRFVISVAKQYQNNGLPLVDLIQEGCSGIIVAASKYNPDKGCKFISYAVWWIRQSILQALCDQCRTVRLPVNHLNNISKINKVIEKFEQNYGRTPTDCEIEQETNINSSKVNFAISSSGRSISLDNSIIDEENGSLLDIIPDENCKEADEDILCEQNNKELMKILDNLNPRDHDIILMYFGIGMIPMQYEEIANRFGIGGERVRQILHSTLEYLRNNYKEELKSLL